MLPRRNIATSMNAINMGDGEPTHPQEPETVEILVSDAVNQNTAKLLAAAAQLVMAMAKARVPEPRMVERGSSFKDFFNHIFPLFDGTGGYLNDIKEH
ncbi:hypothetical protein SLA2020_439810 [Shorea laevis]